jgi:DNA-binding transcriptional ArsR family regulator
MVDHQSPSLDLAFGALADRTRRAMLFRIATATATVTELAAPFDMSVAAVSKHLMVLERAGLIIKKKEGRHFRCQLNPAPFKDVADVVRHFEAFWAARLDALETYFTDKNEKRGAPHENPRKKRAAQSGAAKSRPRAPKRGV